MMKKIIRKTVAATLVTLAAGATQAAEWGYSGQQNVYTPEQWSKVSATCGTGKQQSPIHIIDNEAQPSELKVKIHYAAHGTPYENNGHAVVVDLSGASQPARWIELFETPADPGTRYNLLQMQFHTPSEHSFSASRPLAPQHYPMALHLVHKDQQGKLAVIGLMIQEGAHNQALDELFSKLADPRGGGQKSGTLSMTPDLAGLLPDDGTLFSYNGSLTTPPCTEGVKWLVYAHPIKMSAQQIQTYRNLFTQSGHPYHTNRPTQKLNSLMVNFLQKRKVHLGTAVKH